MQEKWKAVIDALENLDMHNIEGNMIYSKRSVKTFSEEAPLLYKICLLAVPDASNETLDKIMKTIKESDALNK